MILVLTFVTFIITQRPKNQFSYQSTKYPFSQVQTNIFRNLFSFRTETQQNSQFCTFLSFIGRYSNQSTSRTFENSKSNKNQSQKPLKTSLRNFSFRHKDWKSFYEGSQEPVKLSSPRTLLYVCDRQNVYILSCFKHKKKWWCNFIFRCISTLKTSC